MDAFNFRKLFKSAAFGLKALRLLHIGTIFIAWYSQGLIRQDKTYFKIYFELFVFVSIIQWPDHYFLMIKLFRQPVYLSHIVLLFH